MKTIYIDVYFLINFTVNLLSLYFGARLSRFHSTVVRLVICAFIGAAYSVFDVLFELGIFSLLFGILSLFAMCIIIGKKISLIRRLRFFLFFILCEVIIGGLVHFGYSLLDRFVGEYINDSLEGGENRSALIISVLILLSIGVLKLLIMLFTNLGGEKNVKIRIEIEDKSVTAEAFLDSGNLVRDPMNMRPVLFIKESLAQRLFPKSVIELTDLDSLSKEYQKRIRLIPVTRLGKTHVMTGVIADRISLVLDGRDEEIDFTVAIDKEGGSFAGYEALAPYGALNNVI